MAGMGAFQSGLAASAAIEPDPVPLDRESEG